MMDDVITHTEQFTKQRSLLFGLAYRMLGTVMDAEDILQEAGLRWQAVPAGTVESAKAYLSTMVARMCIDHLRLARVQRESYVGTWLPEPLTEAYSAGQTDTVALAESLSTAFLVTLETLNPVERAVFLLHDVFDYSFYEIASIVDKSESNCRKIASRARTAINARKPRFSPNVKAKQQLTQQFMLACAQGELSALINMLTEDISIWSDGGGKAVAARKIIYGPQNCASFILGILKNAPASFVPVPTAINGQPGLIAYIDGKAQTAVSFSIVNEQIQAMHFVVNPDKLQHIPPISLSS